MAIVRKYWADYTGAIAIERGSIVANISRAIIAGWPPHQADTTFINSSLK
jgi:Flp pilus assembly pilin Flp